MRIGAREKVTFITFSLQNAFFAKILAYIEKSCHFVEEFGLFIQTMSFKRLHTLFAAGLLLCSLSCFATVSHSGRSLTIVQPLDVCSAIQEQNGSINTGSARAIIADSYFDALGHKSIAVLRKGATDSKDLLTDYSCDFAGKVTRISKPLPVYPSSIILKEDLPSAPTTLL